MTGAGAITGDGNYNVEFNLYSVSSAGTSLWTEDYLNSASQGVHVVNGYLTANLGSITAFPSTINWNQDLWIGMTVRGTASCAFAACTPTDAEMSPRLKLTAVPYAFRAGQLAQFNATSGFTSTLNLVQPTVGNQIFQIQDQGAAGTYNVLTAPVGSDGYIKLQGSTPGTAQTGHFNISGTGIAGALQAASLDTASAGTLTIGGNANTTAISISQNTTLAAGKSITITGGITGTRPASPTTGMLYFDTTTNQLIQYNGTKWVSAPRSATKIVAASNSSQAEKDAADYVATGTGDQTTINSALTALPAAGGTVYLTEGTYTLGAAISVPNNTILAGAGAATILTVPNAQNGTYAMITNTDTTTGTHVVIRDLLIDGNKANQTAGVMEAVYFNGIGSGSGATARDGGRVAGVTVRNMLGYGVYLFSALNGTITNNTVLGTVSGGIVLDGASTNNLLTDNVVQGNSSYGILIWASSNGNTLTGNTVQGNPSYGIYINASTGNTITGNEVQGNGTAGVVLNASANGNAVTGNTINSDTIGVLVSGSNYNTIANNMVQGNVTAGVYIFSTSNNNNVTGNKIHDSGGATTNGGVYLSGANSNMIVGNDITDTSCTTTCSAITVNGGTTVNTYIANNNFSGTAANPANIFNTGTGTIFANQADGSGNLVNISQGGGFTVGAASASSTLTIQGGTASIQLSTPGAPTVTPNVTGAVSYTYKVSALDGTGETLPSTGTTIANGAATPNNTITWTPVGGAYQYRVYRTAGGATQGLLSTVAGNTLTYTDNNGVASGSVSANNTTGGGTFAGALQGTRGIFTSGNALTLGTASSSGGVILFYSGLGSGSVTLNTNTPGASNFTLSLPAENGTLCSTGSVCTGYAPATGGTGYVQLQGATPGTAQTGHFNISGTGIAGAFQAASLDTASAGALSLGATTATSVNIGNQTGSFGVSIVAGLGNIAIGNTTMTGAITLNTAGSTLIGTTIGVGNISIGRASNTLAINAGTTNLNSTTTNISTTAAVNAVTIGSTNTTSSLLLQAGTGGLQIQTQGGGVLGVGNNAVAQALVIGNNTGTTSVGINAGSGGISIGNNGLANTIQIGNTTGTVTQTINIGNNATAGSTSTINIGSTVGTSATTIQGGTGNILLQTNNSAASTIVKALTSSAAAFQVQNTGGVALLTADTLNTKVAFRGASTGDVATVGAELLSGNCTGTNWSGTGSGPYAHTAGSVAALTCSIAGGVTIGTTYQVVFTVLGMGATDQITPGIGGGAGSRTVGNVAGMTDLITATTTANPTFTISNSASTGTITAISFKIVTPALPLIQINNSSNTVALEIRAPSSVTNSFIGLNAGQANSTGSLLTAVGSGALQSNTTGSNNTATGANALSSNTVGTSNTAIGANALNSNTIGVNNTAVGGSSLSSNTSGINNVATGASTLVNNSAGSRNVAVGTGALQNNTIGTYNVALGDAGLNVNSTGSNNTALGGRALQSVTTGSGNTAVGYWAGSFDLNGTFTTLGTLQNATAIGAYTQVQKSNTIVLGSVDNSTQVVVGATVPVGTNIFGVSPVDLNSTTVTASQTSGSGTITASAAIFSASNVGEELIWADGSTETITAFTSSTVVTGSSTTITEASSNFRTHHIGLQVTNTGDVYAQNTSTTAFSVQNAVGTSILNIDTSTSSSTLKSNSTTALQIQNSIGQQIFDFDTLNKTFQIGSSLNATGKIAFFNSVNSLSTTLNATTPTTASKTISLPDENGTLCIQGSTSCNFAPSTGGTGYVNLQGSTPGTAQTGHFNISGTGIIGTQLQAGQAVITGAANQTQLIVKANASQTAANPLIMLQTSTGTEIARINAIGSNFFAGNSAGAVNSGSQNNGIGNLALNSNTSGTGNTAFGDSALQLNVTGGANTAVGGSALVTNTGSNNTGIGSTALRDNTTGSSNTAVGNQALYFNTTGSNNTGIGNNAGWCDTSFIFCSSNNLQNATVIGAGTQVQASNTIVLGSVDTATSVVIGATKPVSTNLFGVSPLDTTAGTAGTGGVSSTSVTGIGTAFASTMIGEQMIWADGQSSTIATVSSATALTLSTAVTEANASAYRIHHIGFQVTNTGNAYVQNTSTTAFSVQNAVGTPLLNADTSANSVTVKGGSSTLFQIQDAVSSQVLTIDTTADSANLITNPSFESAGTATWAAKAGATLGRSTTQHYSGTASMLVTTTATANDGVKYPLVLAANTFYQISFNAYGSSAFSTMAFGYSSDGTTEATYVTSAQSVASGSWKHYYMNFTTPATVNAGAYLFVKQTDATSRTFYIDNVDVDGIQYGGLAYAGSYNDNRISIGGNGSSVTNLGIGTTSPHGALEIDQKFGQTGLLLQGSGDGGLSAANLLQVMNANGSTAISYSEPINRTIIQGGNSFFNTAALQVITSQAGATALRVSGTTSQTADIFQVSIDTGSTNKVFSVGATGAVLSKNSANSTTAFQIQNAAGTALMVVDTSTSTVTFGNGGNTLTLTAGTFEPILAGTAQHSKSIVLTPEYAGAVLDSAGDTAGATNCSTSNSGTMTSGFQTGITGFGNTTQSYYKWTTAAGTNQCYDVVVQVPIPSDFSAWASSTPIAISTYTSNTTNGLINLEARNTAGTVETNCNYVSVTPGSTTTWTASGGGCTIAGSYTAGGYMTLRVRMTSPASGDVRIGNITLNYKSSF